MARFIDRQPKLEPFEIYSWLYSRKYGGFSGRLEIERRLYAQTPFKKDPDCPDEYPVDRDSMNQFYRLGILERHTLITNGRNHRFSTGESDYDYDMFKERGRRLMNMLGIITESCDEDQDLLMAFLRGVTDFYHVHDQIFEGFPVQQ